MALRVGTNDNQHLWGTLENDQMYGYGGADIMYGYGGHDELYGGTGRDVLWGGEDNDLLDGGAHADALYGGSGVDTASYLYSPVGVFVSLGENIAFYGEAEGDTFSSIENLSGSEFDDTLLGDGNNNRLLGKNGNDFLAGGDGYDTLYGGWHNDMLLGGDGNDFLYGEGGKDLLRGGMGPDMLTGGGDADIFSWLWIDETGVLAWAMDTITDFRRWEGDVLDLHLIDANVNANGDQAFNFVGTVDHFSGTPGEVGYYVSNGNTYIVMQNDANADYDGVIRIEGVHTVDNTWFVF